MGDKLLVRGPKRAEAVVKLLAEHKAEVLAALSPSIGSWWRERFAAKAVQWFVGDRDWDAAKRRPGATWKTSGTISTESAALHGNAQGATRRSAARRA
jgi:hypothetical protein